VRPRTSSSSLGYREPSLSDLLARVDEQARAPREGVTVLVALPVGDHDGARLVGVLDRDLPGGLRDLGQTLGLACLEELDHARQAVRDVRASDAAGVEGAHRELCPGLPDRLRRDDADRIADLGQVARGQRAAVAELADPGGGLALQHRADRNADDRALLGVVLPS